MISSTCIDCSSTVKIQLIQNVNTNEKDFSTYDFTLEQQNTKHFVSTSVLG